MAKPINNQYLSAQSSAILFIVKPIFNDKPLSNLFLSTKQSQMPQSTTLKKTTNKPTTFPNKPQTLKKIQK